MHFVSFVIQSPVFQQSLDGNSVGSGVKHLRVGDVENLFIPVPPLAEQKEIVRRVESLFALGDRIAARYMKSVAEVEKLGQAVIAKGFRGELVPTEAALAKAEGRSYETAAELFARIKNEQTTAPENGRTRKNGAKRHARR